MAIFNTTNASVLMPREIADGMVKKTQSLSTVALLSRHKPMRFGKQDVVVFDNLPKAEFVEEGADKASTTGSFSSVWIFCIVCDVAIAVLAVAAMKLSRRLARADGPSLEEASSEETLPSPAT